MSQLQVTGEAKIRDLQGPVVANAGVITALDGSASQYVRGDGTLADFPTSTGGGSSVSFYLNGSVNQGTFGGSAYKQLGENAITGVGTNFSASTNGLIAQFITDANVPDQTEIPSGNWNIEFYMGVSASSGALASFYVEIYKYDGSTFTLIGSNAATPEYLTNTTTIDAYFTSVAMPLTALAQTDRIAIRVFVNVAGKTVTLYTEDNRLCQVVTTFSRGILSLNNLTDQQQYFAVGTSGTNFNIASSVDTHTFNLPVASATNTGKLSSTDWSIFNAKQPAGNYVTLDTTQTITSEKTFSNTITFADYVLMNIGVALAKTSGTPLYASTNGYANLQLVNAASVNSLYLNDGDTGKFTKLSFNNAADYTYTFPTASGTIALTSNLSSYVPYTGATTNVNLGSYGITGNDFNAQGLKTENSTLFKHQSNFIVTQAGYTAIGGSANGLYFNINANGRIQEFIFNSTGDRVYTFPASSGTLALTSDLSSYVPYSGATGPVDLGSYDLLVNGVRAGKGGGTGSNNTRFGALAFMANTTGSYNAALGTLTLNANTTGANNTAVGNAALQLNTTGGSNTSVGAFTLTNNTTGVGNVALGTGSLAGITTGSYNIAIGINTANLITTGDFNTIIGNYSGSTNLTSNIILADGAGNVRYQWNGTNNVFGNAVQASAYRLTGMTAGSGALYWTSDRVTLANYNASGVVHIEANGGTGVATFGGATYNNDFVGTGRFTGALNGTSATFSSSVTATSFSINSNGTLSSNGFWGTLTTKGSGSYADWSLINSGGNGIMWNPTGTLNMAFGGNVGIGTSSPSALLHVLGGSGVNQPVIFGISGTTLYTTYRISTNTDIGYIGSGTGLFSGGSSTDFGMRAENNLVFGVSNTERMRITSGGNVLIGTTTDAGYKLYVNGSVAATSGFFDTSDKRLKKEITDNPTIKGIESIKPKLYVKADREELGYYAQDLQEVLPSAVTEGSDGFLSLSYAQVHTAKIAQLEAEVAELKELIKTLL